MLDYTPSLPNRQLCKSGCKSGKTRELVVAGTPYIVIYRAKGNRLEILRIFNSARQHKSSAKMKLEVWRSELRNKAIKIKHHIDFKKVLNLYFEFQGLLRTFFFFYSQSCRKCRVCGFTK